MGQAASLRIRPQCANGRRKRNASTICNQLHAANGNVACAATDIEASNTCNQNPLLPAKFLFCVFSFSGCQLFYVARTFVVFTDVFDGFNTECFQDGYIDVGQFFYVDADFTHLEFAESG